MKKSGESVPIRAEIDSKFILRFLIIGIVMIGFGLYCVYDGFIAYPKELEKAKGFYTQTVSPDGKMEWTPVPAEQWQEIAEANNWTLSEPHKPDVMQGKIYWQYGMAIMSFLVGIPILVHYLRSKNAWIEADETGISNHSGQKVAYSEIEGVDKSRWEKKGIAKVAYTADQKKKIFVIDDLKFLRKPTDEIMATVESNIDRELVKGAPLESELPSASPIPENTDDPEEL